MPAILFLDLLFFSLQEIPPYETKPVMRANFIGRVETNHTAFIRIKTNHEQAQGVLILPVEVEVTSGKCFYICLLSNYPIPCFIYIYIFLIKC